MNSADEFNPLPDDDTHVFHAATASAVHDPASPEKLGWRSLGGIETGGQQQLFEPPHAGEGVAARNTPGASAPAYPELAQEEGRAEPAILTPGGSDESALDAGLTLVCRQCFSANLLALDHLGQPLDHTGQRLLSHDPQVQMAGGLSYRCLQCGEVWQPERSGGGEMCQPDRTASPSPPSPPALPIRL